jgi:hypothetical protein
MRRILLLAATMALALMLVGEVAISKQPQDPPDKGSGSIPRSTVVKASFASGSGTNFLGVKVSDRGNLLSFESPQGQENAFSDAEGYAVCSTQFGDETVGERVNGHDTGSVFGGFADPTFSQPNGAGTFPLTVTRRTIDGKFQLTQVWNKPDTVEKDVTVAMTLKNISSAPINGVFLSRSGDFDVGTSSLDQGATTADSTWQWDDGSSSADSSRVGTMLTALTFGTSHFPRVEQRPNWVAASGTRTGCFAKNSLATPTSVQDLAMRVTYEVGSLSAGQSKTVKFEYGRM